MYDIRFFRIIPFVLVSFLLVLLLTGTVFALNVTVDSPSPVPPVTSQGDSVFIYGTATGRPQQGLQVWLIGTNYTRVNTVAIGRDKSYEYEITKTETKNLAPGQYFVIVQHPMMNGEFDIVSVSGTGEVINRQLGNSAAGGMGIFKLTGPGSLQGPAAASAPLNAVASQNIDDTFVTTSFTINPPSVRVDPIPDHVSGDRFTITGTTNLAAGDQLRIEITSSSFSPTGKQQPSEFSGTGGTVIVRQGAGGLNLWSFDFDASSYRMDEYIIKVIGVMTDVTGTATFNIVDRLTPAITATTIPQSAPLTSAATVSSTAAPAAGTPSRTPAAKTPMVPGSAAAALAAVALAKKRRS